VRACDVSLSDLALALQILLGQFKSALRLPCNQPSVLSGMLAHFNHFTGLDKTATVDEVFRQMHRVPPTAQPINASETA